jgi:hypothetical protein
MPNFGQIIFFHLCFSDKMEGQDTASQPPTESHEDITHPPPVEADVGLPNEPISAESSLPSQPPTQPQKPNDSGSNGASSSSDASLEVLISTHFPTLSDVQALLNPLNLVDTAMEEEEPPSKDPPKTKNEMELSEILKQFRMANDQVFVFLLTSNTLHFLSQNLELTPTSDSRHLSDRCPQTTRQNCPSR